MENLYECDAWKDIPLPDFVVADVTNLDAIKNSTLRTKAAPVNFPLTDEDKRDIYLLTKKFRGEELISGLAAPQIGIAKRIIVFEVKDIYEDQKPFPFSIWINPSFEKLNNEMDVDFEECFSVKGMAGPVQRWSSVNYRAFDMNGQLVQGLAEGVTARVIQHETDHLDGKLFIDYVPKDRLLTTQEYHRFIEQLNERIQQNTLT